MGFNHSSVRIKSGGQYAVKQGGQFRAKHGGHIKMKRGGQLVRNIHTLAQKASIGYLSGYQYFKNYEINRKSSIYGCCSNPLTPKHFEK
jgi:hypothetical protein